MLFKTRLMIVFVMCAGVLAGCSNDPREPLSEAACSAAGGESVGVAGAPGNGLGDPGVDLSRTDRCPGGRKTLGVLDPAGDANGALCCQVPPELSITACQAAGGYVLGDPGGGSSYREGCPNGGELLGWLTSCETPGLCGEGGICCRGGK